MQSPIIANIITVILCTGIGWLCLQKYSWISPILMIFVFSLLGLHLFLTNAKFLGVYIVPIYFIVMTTSTIVSKKIVFPFLISPRRFYAHSIGILKDPWRPPGPIVGPITINITYVVYLYIVTYYTLKLISLRKTGKFEGKIVAKYAIKLSLLSYIIAVTFGMSSTLSSYIDLAVHSLPFKQDLLVGIPVALLSSLMLILKYAPAVLEETTGAKQQILDIWDMFV